MALADLQTALANIDAQIAALSAERTDSFSFEGVSVNKKKLTDLLAQREALLEAIAREGGPTEIYSRWIPTG